MSAPGFSLPPSAAFGAADTFVHSDVKCLLGTYRVLGVGETVATLTWFPPQGSLPFGRKPVSPLIISGHAG